MINLDKNSRISLNIGIIGSKNFKDKDLVFAWLDRLHNELGPFDKVITGRIGGVDTFGENWAKENNIETKIYFADWTTYGKRATFIRNIFIVDNSDIVIAFWDDNSSKDTAHAIRITRTSNKPLLVISDKGQVNELLSTIKLSD